MTDNGAGPSPLERLRARYREATAKPPQTLDVPVGRTAAGDLLVVYREPDWNETQDSRARWLASDDPRAPLYAQAEVLAKSVADIKLRDGSDWLDGLGTGGPVNFHSAAVALELPVGDDPLQAVFLVLDSDWEVERHGRELATWEPQTASSEVEEQLMGESGPAGSTST